MGILNAKPDEKKAYYVKQANDLSRQADKVRQETGNNVEANRLDSIARDSADAAKMVDKQLADIADKLRQS